MAATIVRAQREYHALLATFWPFNYKMPFFDLI